MKIIQYPAYQTSIRKFILNILKGLIYNIIQFTALLQSRNYIKQVSLSLKKAEFILLFKCDKITAYFASGSYFDSHESNPERSNLTSGEWPQFSPTTYRY